MNKLYLLIGLLVMISISACVDRRINSTPQHSEKELSTLFEMMSGEFSSEEQANQDSLFYNINLVMFPIWEKDQTAKWLYVEQAVTKFIDKPYRQRVYKVSMTEKNIIESSVFELPNPTRFVHAWKNPAIFDQINADSLIVRQGCAVFLTKDKQCFSGSTKDQDCKSTLRGATYATSKVSICQDEIISWDQGWDGEDQQVWGAETKGYIFKRK
ncbi:MAG: chromophore lyase CpcT/CpeT [Saprospiraceae bacterium]